MVLNGTSTQHPIPGVGFADDRVLPFITDAGFDPKAALAASLAIRQARQEPRVTWSSYHRLHGEGILLYYGLPGGGAWFVRYTEDDGLVTELHDSETSAAEHQVVDAKLFRLGGYRRMDVDTWVRPEDPRNADVLVPGARDVTAQELAPFDPHLTKWIAAGGNPEAVVSFTAPELDPTLLIGLSEIERLTGVQAGTLRSMRSRGELPHPASVKNTSPLWTRPVILHWAERLNPWFTPVRIDLAAVPNVHTPLCGPIERRDDAVAFALAEAEAFAGKTGGRYEPKRDSAYVWAGDDSNTDGDTYFGVSDTANPTVTLDAILT